MTVYVQLPFFKGHWFSYIKTLQLKLFPCQSFFFFFFFPLPIISSWELLRRFLLWEDVGLGLRFLFCLGFFHSLPSQEGLDYCIFYSCLLSNSDWSREHQPENENLTTVSSKEIQCVCVGCKRCAFFNLGGMCCNSPTAEMRNWKLSGIVLLWFQNWIWKSSVFWDCEPHSSFQADGYWAFWMAKRSWNNLGKAGPCCLILLEGLQTG